MLTPTRICREEAKLQRPQSVEPMAVARLDAVKKKSNIHVQGPAVLRKGQGWAWDGGHDGDSDLGMGDGNIH